MILEVLLSFFFFFILFFFGWQLSRHFLKEDRIEYLLGLSGIFGISFYIFFVNALGYLMPIKIVFYFVLLSFFIFGLEIFYLNKSKSPLKWSLNKKWRKILLGTALLLAIINSLVYFRFPPVLHEPGGLPITATIAEGNFPVKEMYYPENNLRYHYTLELFSAAIYKTTGLPTYIANNFQIAILTGTLFLLGFCLIKTFFSNNNFKAFTSSLMMMYAGGLVFLNGLKGIPIIYNLYTRDQNTSTSFKFVTDSINSEFSVPVIMNVVRFTWAFLAFALIITIIYLYFHLINQEKNKIAILLCSLLLAVLALSGEVFFALLCFIFFIYPFILGYTKKDWQIAKKYFFVSFWILSITVPISFIQGGFLKSVSDIIGFKITHFIGVGENIFHINKVPFILDNFTPEPSPILRPEFYLQGLLIFLLIIPSFIFLFKKNYQLSFFLVILSITAFLIPLCLTTANFGYIAELLNYNVRLGEMWRFFWIVNLIGGIAIGLYFADLFLLTNKIWLKRTIILLTIILMTQGLLFQLLYLTTGYPRSTWNSSDKYYAKTGSYEKRGYDWIKENTTVNDLFLITEKDCKYSNYSVGPATHHRFIINTGRMAPIYSWYCSYPSDESYKKIQESCDLQAIKKLNYSYLYVDENWINGLEEKCVKNNNLELKFEASERDKFSRIYKILN